MRKKNPNIETTYQKVVNLYNSNITDYNILADMLGIKLSTVNTYLSLARKNGDIKKKNILKMVVDTYCSGITQPSKISKKLGISVQTVIKYIKLGKNQNLIEPSKSLYMRIVEMYNSGIKRYKDIAKNLDISKDTVKHYIAKARTDGLVSPREYKNTKNKKQQTNEQEEISKEDEVKKEKDKALGNLEKKQKLEEKIRSELIQSIYPREVAKKLKIKTWQVYEYLENLSSSDAKKLKRDRLKNNKLYDIIVFRKNKESNQGQTKSNIVESILYDMNKNFIDFESRINLARIYFILGNVKASEKILNQMIYDTNYSENIRNTIKTEFDKVHSENLAIQIRSAYRNGQNIDGSNISYNDLCSRYGIRTGEVVDALGMENNEQEL